MFVFVFECVRVFVLFVSVCVSVCLFVLFVLFVFLFFLMFLEVTLRHRPDRNLARRSHHGVSCEVDLARCPAAEEGRIRAVDLDIARHPMGQPGILFENIEMFPARFQRAGTLPVPPHAVAIAVRQQVRQLREQEAILSTDLDRQTYS